MAVPDELPPIHRKVVKIPQTTGYSGDFPSVLLCGNALRECPLWVKSGHRIAAR